ncbi:hypothetical protein GCM10018965_053870 [Nonomuraea roseola]
MPSLCVGLVVGVGLGTGVREGVGLVLGAGVTGLAVAVAVAHPAIAVHAATATAMADMWCFTKSPLSRLELTGDRVGQGCAPPRPAPLADYLLVGNPRFTPPCEGSSHREVTTLPRV